MLFSRIQKLFGRNAQPSRRRQPARVRPRLEHLETRTLLSATIYVNAADASNLTQNGSAANPYGTIQQGLAHANPGDTIKVAAGNYQEQVLIYQNSSNVTLNNITLLGANQKSIIDPSVNSQSANLVEVEGATGVTIRGFTIAGPGAGVGSIGTGIQVDSGASATIAGDHITNIRDNPISGDQNGVAIVVNGSATISGNLIDNFQKAGIVVDGSGAQAKVSYNVVKGYPDNTAIPSNGIIFMEGATGSITNNIVSGIVYKGSVTDGENPFEGGLPLGWDGVGILLFQSGVATVSGNAVLHNDIGIWDFAGAAGTSITRNAVASSTFDGIALEETGSAATTVAQNAVGGSGHDGIEFLFDPTGSESGVADSLHNLNVTVVGNIAVGNKNDGIDVEAGSVGNVLKNNVLLGNGNFDAQDNSTGTATAGTGNTWQHNFGLRSNPRGLVGF